jgi:hypothetical protein
MQWLKDTNLRSSKTSSIQIDFGIFATELASSPTAIRLLWQGSQNKDD